jgi:hypothetical protein
VGDGGRENRGQASSICRFDRISEIVDKSGTQQHVIGNRKTGNRSTINKGEGLKNREPPAVK